MIWKWVQRLVGKLTFIEKVEFKNHEIYLYYKKNEELKFRKLPFRADKNRLLDELEKIKVDINYYETREKKNYKLAGFAFSNPDEHLGETIEKGTTG